MNRHRINPMDVFIFDADAIAQPTFPVPAGVRESFTPPVVGIGRNHWSPKDIEISEAWRAQVESLGYRIDTPEDFHRIVVSRMITASPQCPAPFSTADKRTTGGGS